MAALSFLFAYALSVIALAKPLNAPSGLLMDLKPAPHSGVDQARPQLTWIVPHLTGCAATGQMQGAFHVQLSTSPKFSGNLLSDTGRVTSASSTSVPWPGVDLEPASVYWWRVRTWSHDGCDSSWSEPTKVITGMFANNFTKAKPVWADGARYSFLRQVLKLKAAVTSAHVYVAATQDGSKERLLGAYRLYLDGNVVGTGPGRGEVQNSDPGHIQYDTIDVTHVMKGLHGSVVVSLQGYHHKGDNSAMIIAELHVQFADGTQQVLGTDSTWLSFNADSVFNPTANTGGDFSDQPLEYIDARNSPSGDSCQTCWRLPSFKPTAAWRPASERPAFSPTLRAKQTQAIQVFARNSPVSVVQVGPGHWFFDFGTEIMGGIELDWNGDNTANATQLDLRMGEELTTNTSILYPMRTGNKYQMTWTAGPGNSSFEQHEYFLFRYGELKASGSQPPISGGQCVKLEPKMDEGQEAVFSCPSGKVISKVTFASYGTPTGECHKDGGNDFAADSHCHAASSAKTVEALCLGKARCTFKADNTVFGEDPCHKTAKGFSGAVECSQGNFATGEDPADEPPFKLTAWVVRYPWVDTDSAFDSSDSTLNSVWNLCSNTLKVTSLDTTTDSNTRERLPYEADGYITGSSRYVFQREYTWQRHSTKHNMLNPTWPTEWRQTIPLMVYTDYMMTGDLDLTQDVIDILNVSTQSSCIDHTTNLVDFTHCQREAGTRDIVDWPSSARDGYKLTDVNTVVNAYGVGSLKAFSTLLNASGRVDEAKRSRQQAETTAKAMSALLHDKATGLFLDGRNVQHSAWHAQVFPLFFGIGDAADPRLLAFFKTKRMTGSVYAAFAFVMGLYNIGYDHGAFALDMLTTCDKNSWCHMIQQGATATMEAWTRDEKPNLSWSHPWASAAATAIAQGVMGITALLPGFEHFKVQPQPGSLAWGKIKLPTLRGFIEARFDQKPSQFTLSLTVPGNTMSTVCLPSLGATGAEIDVDGSPATGYAEGDYVCIGQIGSGDHTISRKASEIRVLI